jgi:hypothetical protein
MDGERQKPRRASASICLTPEDKIGAAPRQLDLWSAEQATNNAFKAVQAAIGRLGHTQSSADESERHPPSNETTEPKFLLVDRVGAVPTAAPAWDHDLRVDDPPAINDAFSESRRFRPAVILGAILVMLGLGWAGGWASYRLLADAPSTAPIKQVKAADCASEPGKEADCASFKSDREMAASVGTTGKIAAAAPTAIGRVREPARGSTQQIGTVASREATPAQSSASSPASAVAKERTKTSARSTTSVSEARPTAPVPETKPTTIDGWTVREVVGGTAVLQGPDGIWQAQTGDTVPGVGRVDSIVRWGNRWIVATSRGLISTQN